MIPAMMGSTGMVAIVHDDDNDVHTSCIGRVISSPEGTTWMACCKYYLIDFIIIA